MIKKTIAGLVLAASVAPVWAANTLFLTTNETRSAGARIVNSAWAGLQGAVAATDTLVDGRNTLSASGVLDTAALDAADIVFVVTVYEAADAAKLDVVMNAMRSHPDKTFVIFTDGCCSRASNTDKIVAALDSATHWGVSWVGRTGRIDSRVNPLSPYAGPFTSGPNPLEGLDYGLIQNVPGENALYLENGATSANPVDRVNAFGFFVPSPAMDGGQGACTFVTADTSPFYLVTATADTQSRPIMSNFLAAAKDPNGPCKMGSSAVDLTPTISGPTNVTVGSNASLTFDVRNLGGSASADGVLSITLPKGVRAGSPLPTACTVAPGATPTTPQTITCTLAAIAAGGISHLTVPVQITELGTHTVNAEVLSVTNENIVVNNSAQHALVAAAAPVAVPVGTWPVLALLSLLMSAFARRRRH